jgi:hypothetical protein
MQFIKISVISGCQCQCSKTKQQIVIKTKQELESKLAATNKSLKPVLPSAKEDFCDRHAGLHHVHRQCPATMDHYSGHTYRQFFGYSPHEEDP